ncbi:MAG TPA: DUF2007 domain-containing protein [Chitinophagaceae bacterium]|nr:DUF2007 domain-containing protein [Chitinophagaceae bacterium]
MAYVQIRTSDNYIYANILLSRLQEEGFDCHLKDENTVRVDPLLSPAIGGIKLMVKEEDEARASAALDRIEAEYLSTIPCPKCGQYSLQRLKKVRSSKNFFDALVSQLFMGSTQSEQVFYRCIHCGYWSKKMPDAPPG